MSNIEERVVSMKFDNKQFGDGIKSTLGSLDALNKGLKLEGATKGLDDVAKSASKLSLDGVGKGVDAIADKFKAMSVVGITALVAITTKALSAGEALAKSLSVSPIKAGLDEYETNLNAIQTILSNTQWQHTGLKDVNAALGELNTYSDKTIYNFSEMARNIGTFTAAGVKLNVSVNAIKGIANLAAISGSSADQASTAMYQLSQALATGTLKLQDWNSVVNAGMGGKNFQDALKETARVHGVAVDKIIKEEGSFRDSLQKGWLTSQILTETLSKYTGDLTASQLKAMGYNDKQIVGILKMGKTAQDAATKVKTFSQLISTLQESAGSGWTNTWQLIFGDFDEAKNLFTGVYTVLGGFITASGNARNSVLKDWKALGGRTAIIKAISNAFYALIAVLKPIKDAFREIFPATTGKELADLSKTLEKFTAGLKIGADTADKLKRTFAGVFAILGIGWDIIKEGVKAFFDLFGSITDGSGSILNTTANVGDFLVALKKFLVDGGKIHDFFQGLVNVLEKPIALIKEFVGWLVGAIKGVHTDATPAIDGLSKALTPLQDIGNRLKSIWDGLIQVFKFLGEKVVTVGKAIKDFILSVAKQLEGGFGHIDYSKVLDGVNTGLLAAIVLLVKKFLSGGIELDFTGGFLDKLKAAFGGLTSTLKAMQLQLKAKALLEIAAAVAILTVAVIALSLIDSKKLASAMAGLTVMLTDLFASMAIFEKISGSKGFAKMPFVAASMILLAVALDLMTIAVKQLSELDWNQLAKGLVGLTVMLDSLVIAVRGMPQEKMIATGAGLVIIAAAIKILASAMKDFSDLSWADMAKGLAGVALVLASLALVSKVMESDKGGVLQDVEFLLLAASVKVLASAVGAFAKLSWGEVAKGLVSMAGALAILVTAVDDIPPEAVLGAASILIVSLSLGKIADALDQMGQMSWGAIGKGLTAMLGAITIISLAVGLVPPTAPLAAGAIWIVAQVLGKVADVLDQMGQMSWGAIGKAMTVLAGSLTIIALTVTGMVLALPGAAALVVITAALAAFLPILLAIGLMSWGDITGGMLKLAAALGILGLTSLILSPLTPVIAALGIAVAIFSVGLLAAGLGVLAFGTGLTLLSELGKVAAANIVVIITDLINLIPFFLLKLAEGLVGFAKVIADGGPAFVKALTTVLLSLITAIDTLTPKIVNTLVKLVFLLVDTLVKNVPKLVDSGLKLLTGILNGIANNIGQIVTAGTNIIVNFLNGITKNQPKVLQAAADMIIGFVENLAKTINNNTDKMNKAGADLAKAIINGMTGGLLGGSSKIAGAAESAAKSALSAAKKVLGIFSPSKEFYKLGAYSTEGMANGLSETAKVVGVASAKVGTTAIGELKKSIVGLPALIKMDDHLHPVVSPVLDLSSFTKDAGQIGTILRQSKPINLGVAISRAKDAQAGHQANQDALDEAQVASNTTVNFTQNNSSPKALSEAEIYRQTNNQLSKVKKEVAV